MKHAIKITVLLALCGLPQVGHAMRIADRLLGLAGFGVMSFATNQASQHKLDTQAVSLATSHQDELIQTSLEVRRLSSQVGLENPEISFHVAKDSEDMRIGGASWNRPLTSPMVQAVPVAGETAIVFNQDYFNLTETQKNAALAPELLRVKNYEYEKEIVAGTVLPLAITTAAFRVAGKGVTSLLSQSSRLVRNKYGALGIQGLSALSQSFLLPFASTTLVAEQTHYEYENGKNSAQIKTMQSLCGGYPLKAVATYTRSRAYAMDAQATKIIGKDAMIEYLSQPSNESKVKYADPAYAPAPTLKERLERVQKISTKS